VNRINMTLMGAAVVGLVSAWGGASQADENTPVVGVGPDFVNPDPNLAPNPLANATVIVSAGAVGSGNQQVSLDVSGIDAPAGTRLGAHVHQNACGSTAGASGGHYLNPAGGTPLEQREVWLDFTVDANGNGHAVATRNWSIDSFATRSVVIHALHTDHSTGVAGSRLACTDIDA
jgi:Cu/Zn superoxide dismutase